MDMVKPIFRGRGVVIRGKLPRVCNACGALMAFVFEPQITDVENTRVYRCDKCKALEYVAANQPVIVS